MQNMFIPALCAGVVGVALTCATTALAQPTIPLGDVTVDLELVADGITSPVKIVHAGDGSGRLFVVDQIGLIHVVDDDGVRATPFLDIAHLLPTLNTSFDERGLLGVAFHPDYANNGRFFVRYSAPRDGVAAEPCFDTSRGCHTAVLAEFAVTADPDVADPTPNVLFQVDEPQFNHNGGDVAFGPDGYLYFALGDGGGRNDGLNEDPPLHGPIGNGQNIETALGAMLRVDVDGGFPYAIPADNPFVGTAGLDEIYAYGFRNPFRFSFDRRGGRLFVADVGQGLFEEVDIVGLGGNYGWVIREGFNCFDPLDDSTPPPSCPNTGLMDEPLLDPVAEYTHDDGISITGGNVYRGNESHLLRGLYIFGDFSRSFAPADGRLFYMDVGDDSDDSDSDTDANSSTELVRVDFSQQYGGNSDSDSDSDSERFVIYEFRLGNRTLPLNEYVIGFGEDESGETYMGTTTNLAPVGNAGRVYRIVASRRVTLCHVPPGNGGNARTIVVSQSAVAAHLRHGDAFGECAAAKNGSSMLAVPDFGNIRP